MKVLLIKIPYVKVARCDAIPPRKCYMNKSAKLLNFIINSSIEILTELTNMTMMEGNISLCHQYLRYCHQSCITVVTEKIIIK